MTSNNKLVLIVDDTPTNVAVISGALKDSFRTKVGNVTVTRIALRFVAD